MGGSLVERWMAAGDAGDVDAFDQWLHDDVVVHAPRGFSTTNLEQEKEAWREAKAAMPDIRHELREVVASGSVIAARCLVTGTVAGECKGVVGSSRSLRIDKALFVRLRDGKVAEVWEIFDTASIRSQLED